MNPRNNKLSLALACALGAGVATIGAAAPAAAQQPRVEKIEVTGSNIKRVEGESALPVTIITRQDIERMGAVSTEDVLRRVSANTAMFSDTTQGVGYAQSFANLRGIGSNSTLILLNGRRLANHAFGNVGGPAAVDLNSIPFNAIERIEVLRDGASAVYGTDAVGGVINFITRADYRGGEITVKGGTTREGKDGRELGFNAAVGFGDPARDRWNLLVTGGSQYNKRLPAIKQRLYMRYVDIEGALDPTSFRGFPGRLADFGFSPGAYAGTLTTDPSFEACDPEFTVVQRAGTTPSGDPRDRCRGLFPAYLDNLPDQRKSDLFGRFTYELANNHQFFAEGSFARNHSIGRIAPVPIDSSIARIKPDGTQDPFLLPLTSRYAPVALINRLGYDVADVAFPGFLDIIYRAAPAGNRINDTQNDQTRLSTGLKGLAAGWDYNTALTYALAKDYLVYTGYVHEGRFRTALASGNLNPFGPNDAQGEALLNAAKMEGPMRDSKSTTLQVDGKGSREIGKLAGGPIAVALGVDVRREKIEDKPINEDYRLGLHVGGEGTVPETSASRTVSAVFGEVNLPFIRNLEASAAVRYDRYSDVGSKTNPRVSLRWQPSRDMLMRASAGAGFRAPSLWDLNAPPAFSNTANQVNDPGCPAALIANQDPRCLQVQLTTRLSSSPDLKPETSKQWSVGMVLEPLRTLSIGLDYWRITKKDNIGVLTADTILANPDDLTLYNQFRDRFVRNAQGTTLYVDQPAENLGGLRTAGWDIDVRVHFPIGPARLGLSFNGTYLTEWEQQNSKDGPYTQYLGNSFNGGTAYPRWTHVVSAEYSHGPWAFVVEQTYTHGWVEAFQLGGTHNIPSHSRINLAASFSGLPNLTLKLGVRNALDHLPPFTDVSSNGSHAQGWANAVADPRGRFWYGSVTYKFK
jgi:iron complex outermembrane receptor protein